MTPAERDQQQQTQQSLLQQNQQQREELSRSFMLPKPEVNHQPSDEQRCFIIHSIQIEQATLLSPSVRERITAPFINQCLGITKISQMVAQISDWYISRGYVTSRAFLVEQDLSSGELHIPVLEGKLQKIVMDNTPSRHL